MSNNYKDNITFNTIETSKADYYLIEKFIFCNKIHLSLTSS